MTTLRFLNLITFIINSLILLLIWYGIIPTFISIITATLSILYTNYENIEIFYYFIKKSKRYEKYLIYLDKINYYKNICKSKFMKIDKYFIYLYKKMKIGKLIEKYIKSDNIDNYLITDTGKVSEGDMIKIIKDILNMENIPNQKDMDIMMKDIKKINKIIKKSIKPM